MNLGLPVYRTLMPFVIPALLASVLSALHFCHADIHWDWLTLWGYPIGSWHWHNATKFPSWIVAAIHHQVASWSKQLHMLFSPRQSRISCNVNGASYLIFEGRWSWSVVTRDPWSWARRAQSGHPKCESSSHSYYAPKLLNTIYIVIKGKWNPWMNN